MQIKIWPDIFFFTEFMMWMKNFIVCSSIYMNMKMKNAPDPKMDLCVLSKVTGRKFMHL